MEGLDMDELDMDDFLEEDFWFIINLHKMILAKIIPFLLMTSCLMNLKNFAYSNKLRLNI
jgi:hypothetical protein